MEIGVIALNLVAEDFKRGYEISNSNPRTEERNAKASQQI